MNLLKLAAATAIILASAAAQAEYVPLKICSSFNRQTGTIVDTVRAAVLAEQVEVEGQEPQMNVVFVIVETNGDQTTETPFMASPLAIDENSIVLDLMGADFAIGDNGIEKDSGFVQIAKRSMQAEDGSEVKVWVGSAFAKGQRYNLICE
jgi:hypothetical protein